MWFSRCFSLDGQLCFCSNIDWLFKCLSLNHNPAQWRLFIDSSKRSLKVVILHNGNLKTSVSFSHSVHLPESYENMNLVLHTVDYGKYSWKIRGDLKAIGMLKEVQSDFTKYCFFLCLWDSRATNKHVESNWPPRTSYQPGLCGVKKNTDKVEVGYLRWTPNQRVTQRLQLQDNRWTGTARLDCFLLGLSELSEQQYSSGIQGWHQ